MLIGNGTQIVPLYIKMVTIIFLIFPKPGW